ncbi:hypothetical protein [Acrocarpospora sp. B8E8]|uniref:hypothetical protein n=1 Tax=Acrocarpospora sp. B8E8 TaxID=3153572 RepID=UPI00325C6953
MSSAVSAARHLTFRVSRERALDVDASVWYASPVDAPIRSGVSGETLAELVAGVEAIKHFVLDVPEEVKIVVKYDIELPGVTADVWKAHRELLTQLIDMGISDDDRARLLTSAVPGVLLSA